MIVVIQSIFHKLDKDLKILSYYNGQAKQIYKQLLNKLKYTVK